MPKSRHAIDPDTPMHWQVLRQLWPYLLEFKTRVVLALVCLILAKIASVALPFVLKHTVDALNSDGILLLTVPLALITAYGTLRFFNVILGEVRDTLFGRVTERAMRRLGLTVFKHLHRLDLHYHLNRRTGGLSRDIERGTSGISFVMRFMVFNIVPTFVELAMVVGILYQQYGIEFALIILVAVVLYVAFSVKATNWRTRFVRQMNQADSTTNTKAVDSLLNYETVKYFNNEAFEAERYDHNLAQWESARRKNRLSLFALNAGQAFIIASAMTSMMVLAALQVQAGKMTIGDFVLINAFTMQIFMPLNFLGFVYREIRGSLANIENLFAILRQQPAISVPSDAPDMHIKHSVIKFDRVSFYYKRGQDERQILDNLCFEIPAGSKVAIVGESGAGKSTIVKLLFRFYDPTEGSITIDGQDINQVTLDSLRKHIGIVPQDTVLFNDSILENIRYGNPHATDDDVHKVIVLAHLNDFIARLPEGLSTQVGERGMKLSGGEKQRIAIARALLKAPPILVFDEATSSLDSQSEQAIIGALKEAAKGHTSLVIAHRLSTVVDADQILVMQQGRIIEQGTHDTLLAEQGYYKALWDAQQKQQH